MLGRGGEDKGEGVVWLRLLPDGRCSMEVVQKETIAERNNS